MILNRKMLLDPNVNVGLFEDLLVMNVEVVIEMGCKEKAKRVRRECFK